MFKRAERSGENVSTVHRPGDEPCYSYDMCACSRVVSSDVLLPPILSAFAQCTHSTLLEMVDVFNLRVPAEQSVAPTSPIARCPPHRARHAYHPAGIIWSVVGRLFKPKTKEIIGGWRKLYNEELHEIRCVLRQILDDHIRQDEMVGAWADMEDNIKMYYQEMGWGMWTGFICLRIGTTDRLL